MKDNNYVWLFAILFLAVGLSLGFGITGNVARSSTDTGSLPVADGGGGSATTTTTTDIGTYMDPKSCYDRYFDTNDTFPDDNYTITVDCSSGTDGKMWFSARLGFVNCVGGGWGQTPTRLWQSWWGGSLPFVEGYTCIDENGNWNRPMDVMAFCCEIQGDNSTKATGTFHKSTIDKSGKITVA